MRSFCFLFLALVSTSSFAAKDIPPPPSSYVLDEPGILGSSSREISAQLAAEDQKTGNQILVAIFKSLDGEDLVDYTNRLFDSWKPGQKGKNNGIILAVYLQEKKMRFEVGYGLEPYLTDAKSKRIMTDFLRPAFVEKKYGEGFIETIRQIQLVIHQDPNGIKEEVPNNGVSGPARSLFFFIFLILVAIIYWVDRFGSTRGWGGQNLGTRRRSGWIGSNDGWGSGGWGGGGGFSGGGGSSGGGGASGDW